MNIQRLVTIHTVVLAIAKLTKTYSCGGYFAKESKRWRFLVEYPDNLHSNFLDYPIFGFFNFKSAFLDTEIGREILNIADGVILVEALRYAIQRINNRKLLKTVISLQMMDCEESRSQMSNFPDHPVILGLTSWQTTYYLLTNHGAKSPIFNIMSSSAKFDRRLTREMRYDEERYWNLMRTVTSDALEVQAIAQVLSTLDWKYVTIVASNDLRTQDVVREFRKVASDHGICIGKTFWLSNLPNGKEYEKLGRTLGKESKPNVIVLFTTATEAIQVISKAGNSTQFSFVTWTGLRANNFTIKPIFKIAKGLIMIQHADTYDKDFAEYFMQLTLNKNGYAWFAEFWSELFDCNVPEKYRILRQPLMKNRRNCSGNEKLDEKVVDLRYAMVKPILNAVDLISCALKQAEIELSECSLKKRSCVKRVAKAALKYVGRKSCQLPYNVKLNIRGYYNRGFTIVNFNGATFNEIGSWFFNESTRKSRFLLQSEKIVFRQQTKTSSSCYSPCRIGELEDRGQNGEICCYRCTACGRNHVVVNKQCISCPKHSRPSINRTSCNELPLVHINLTQKGGWVVILLATVGVTSTTCVAVAFSRNLKNGIIDIAGKELSYYILVALYACFFSSAFYLVKPSVFICGFQRLSFGLILNACYAPMLVKTARIYCSSNSVQKLPKAKSVVSDAKSQIAICLALLTGQSFFNVIWAFNETPETVKHDIHDNTMTALVCKINPVSYVFNLLPCLALIAACTILVYKMRNNNSVIGEAFTMSITMYGSCLLWAILIPLTFLFQGTYGDAFTPSLLMVNFMIIFGLVTLTGLFGPIMLRLLTQGMVKSDCQTELQRKPSLRETGTDPTQADVCLVCLQELEGRSGCTTPCSHAVQNGRMTNHLTL